MRSIIVDIIAVVGFVALVYGCGMVYVPLGWMVGGGLGVAFAIAARQPESDEKP